MIVHAVKTKKIRFSVSDFLKYIIYSKIEILFLGGGGGEITKIYHTAYLDTAGENNFFTFSRNLEVVSNTWN